MAANSRGDGWRGLVVSSVTHVTELPDGSVFRRGGDTLAERENTLAERSVYIYIIYKHMESKMNWKLLLVVFFVLLTACQPTSPVVNLPSDIPVDISCDKEIEVRVLNQTNDQFGLLINILIFNRTTAEVWFPKDFGVSIYQLNDSKVWDKIENTLQYNSNNLTDGFYIQPYRDIFDAGTYMVSPSISHGTQQQPLRIIVVGHRVVLGEITDEQIGAYGDVYIE